jgi:hypothetical protein
MYAREINCVPLFKEFIYSDMSVKAFAEHKQLGYSPMLDRLNTGLRKVGAFIKDADNSLYNRLYWRFSTLKGERQRQVWIEALTLYEAGLLEQENNNQANNNGSSEEMIEKRFNAVEHFTKLVESGEVDIRQALLAMSYVAQTNFK